MSFFLLRRVTPAALPTSYSTNWDATENPLSEGGKWLGGLTVGANWNDMRSASGLCYATSGSLVDYKDCLAVLNSAMYNIPADHQVTLTVSKTAYTPPGSHELEILLRASAANDNFGLYEGLIPYSASEQVVRQNGSYSPGGNFTVLSTGGSGMGGIANGDTLRGKIVGSSLSYYKNGSGTAFMTATDSTHTGGSIGIGAWVSDGGTPENFCSTSWAGQVAV